MKRLEGKSVAVIGLGVSGEAAARLALAKGGEVYVSDTSTDEKTAGRAAALRAAGASVDLGRHDLDRVASAGLVVVSPGIPPNAAVLGELRGRGRSWISEPELAVRFYASPLIAVTGTNGKTTTTLLVAHLLEAAGIRAAAGGNVGGGLAPAASDLALLDEPPDWYVLEMSSFQLGRIDSFRADIGIVTNLSPDHLDYYEEVDAYFADKARLFDNADDSSRWVLPAGDVGVARLAGDAPGERFLFGGDRATGSDAFVDDGMLSLRVDGDLEGLIAQADFPLLGLHNVENALAAALAAYLAGAKSDRLGEGLRTAKALPHRMEPITERHGALWVNDSKATNVAATRAALESLARPVVILLGGKDKGEDFSKLRPALEGRARHVLAFGAAGARIQSEIGPTISAELLTGDLAAVVSRAAELAQPGDLVLLSPACSSFDMFDSYEHRGRVFNDLAREVA